MKQRHQLSECRCRLPLDVSKPCLGGSQGLHSQALASPISIEGKVQSQEKEGRKPMRDAALTGFCVALTDHQRAKRKSAALSPASRTDPEQPENGAVAGELW